MTDKERIKRLELVVYKLCEHATNTDYSWQRWADEMNRFIHDYREEQSDPAESAERGRG